MGGVAPGQYTVPDAPEGELFPDNIGDYNPMLGTKIGPLQYKSTKHRDQMTSILPTDQFTEDGFLINDLRPETLNKRNEYLISTGQENKYGNWNPKANPNWIATSTNQLIPGAISDNMNKAVKPDSAAGTRTSETAGGKRRRAATRDLSLLTSTGNNGSTTGR